MVDCETNENVWKFILIRLRVLPAWLPTDDMIRFIYWLGADDWLWNPSAQ